MKRYSLPQRHCHLKLIASVGLLLAGIAPHSASAASPSLSVILPRGCQRGVEQELTFNGARLADAQEIFFYDRGFEVVKLEPQGDNQVKALVRVAADCRLGEHVAQVRTASGISEYRTFYVGPLPAVAEVEPNSSFDAPQEVAMNVTVQGVVDNEDVDYYVVSASKGQRISVEVEGMRLGTTLFDPYVAILDSKRFELAAADDTPLVMQDAAVSVIVPEDGRYIIEMRDSAYGGNGSCHYRLHIGQFPRPTAVYPPGGKRGDSLEVTFFGDPAGPYKQTVTLPAEANPHYALFASDAGGTGPSEIPFRLFEHGNVLEQEPNDVVAQATPAELPLAMNGIIGTPGDIDFFRFTAKQGQVFEIECFARRLRSPLDAVMVVYNAAGQGLASADDARGPDSYFQWTVPADGEYLLSVTDHLRRGGGDFTYRVELSPVKASLTLGIPRVEQYSQYRQTVYVARGNRFGTLVTASRANVGGEVVLDGTGLPTGVTMVAEPMAANLNVMPVVFEAAADAPLAGSLVDFTGRIANPAGDIVGHFANRADLVIAAPGQSLYRWRDVERLAVAVVDKLPFRLDIVEPKVPLVRNGSMQLKIVATREPGFEGPITVQLPFVPPGVGAASAQTLAAGQTELLFPLNANGGAQLGKWKLYALGSADIGGAAWASSQLASLEVADPPVVFTIERAACEQGQATQLFCKIEHSSPFEGEASVQLMGLPNEVTAPEMKMTRETTQLVFPVTTTANSPAGKHRNLFCQVTILQNGEPIVMRAGDTELQIDAPLPKPAAAPMPTATPAPMPAAPQPPAEKPLSRLQKLRLSAKQAE